LKAIFSIDLDIFDTVLMSYARLSRRPMSFKSFTGLEITEFDIISKQIESKYYEGQVASEEVSESIHTRTQP
jgi:hypothetical protein